MNTPVLIISFDFEIGWGDVTNYRWINRQKKGVYKNLRNVLPKVLAEMDICDIPASWATVGAMFDEPTPDRFEHLPQTARQLVTQALFNSERESFFGKDLFEMVLASQTGHEIIGHSYSHIPFTFPGMTAYAVANDLEKFRIALSKYKLSSHAFVFPENREAYYEVLCEEGYNLVRTAAPRRFRNRPLHWLSTQFSPPPLSTEHLNPFGIRQQNGSLLFNARASKLRIPLLLRQLNLGLDNLFKHGGVFHLWSHPFNFSESPELTIRFIDLLQQIAKKRDAGELQILTFSEGARKPADNVG